MSFRRKLGIPSKMELNKIKKNKNMCPAKKNEKRSKRAKKGKNGNVKIYCKVLTWISRQLNSR